MGGISSTVRRERVANNENVLSVDYRGINHNRLVEENGGTAATISIVGEKVEEEDAHGAGGR